MDRLKPTPHRPTNSNLTQLNSTQLNSAQLNSTQFNSTQLNSTNSTQLNWLESIDRGRASACFATINSIRSRYQRICAVSTGRWVRVDSSFDRIQHRSIEFNCRTEVDLAQPGPAVSDRHYANRKSGVDGLQCG